MSVEAGTVHYIQGEILWGWPTGRPKFGLATEAQAKAALARL